MAGEWLIGWSKRGEVQGFFCSLTFSMKFPLCDLLKWMEEKDTSLSPPSFQSVCKSDNEKVYLTDSSSHVLLCQRSGRQYFIKNIWERCWIDRVSYWPYNLLQAFGRQHFQALCIRHDIDQEPDKIWQNFSQVPETKRGGYAPLRLMCPGSFDRPSWTPKFAILGWLKLSWRWICLAISNVIFSQQSISISMACSYAHLIWAVFMTGNI